MDVDERASAAAERAIDVCIGNAGHALCGLDTPRAAQGGAALAETATSAHRRSGARLMLCHAVTTLGSSSTATRGRRP